MIRANDVRARIAGIRGARDLKAVAYQASEAFVATQDALDLLTREVNSLSTSIVTTESSDEMSITIAYA